MIRILGIETSCDETAIGIVEDGRTVLSNTVASSLSLHGPYGGVIPEIAARAHVETIWDVFAQSLADAKCAPGDLDAIAVTQGPGLPGALLIGVAFAKGLAISLERPLIPVDHLAAHLYAGEMTAPQLQAPYIGLVVSGGHTVLCVAHHDCRFEVLGETQDDAVGEAFDKVAKLLGLGYPGGPVIDRLSTEGEATAVKFPRGQTKGAFDFSFSGLKTAVFHYVQKLSGSLQPPGSRFPPRQVADIAASFQEAAVDMLIGKTLKACQRAGMKQVVVGGGVASNNRLRTKFGEAAAAHQLTVVFPPPSLCVDNGAMIAGIGFPLLQRGRVAELTLAPDSNLCLA
ncbi:MAG: tRNA (adenosine(37)-N6)-threonylcarbamoyltransferase complex transferase subunit TsaD [Candidatus Omnitrophica bacterium]|nr:tRNA (adenosine(37)-N6)-threonylcarbamoyltransferase complex transferase subunit TsaD [Candidatus Omnitrophota bacterium]